MAIVKNGGEKANLGTIGFPSVLKAQLECVNLWKPGGCCLTYLSSLQAERGGGWADSGKGSKEKRIMKADISLRMWENVD